MTVETTLAQERRVLDQSAYALALRLYAVVAALVIKIVGPRAYVADPICTFVFSVLVLFTTVTIMRDVLGVLMEGESTSAT